jgi:hypothetical protein
MIAQPDDSAPHLARRRRHGEVPRRERRDDADRLAQHDIAHAGLARDHPSIDPAALGRIPIDDVAAAQDFEPRLRQRLALFEGHRHRVFLDPFAADLCGALNDRGARRRRCVAPDAKAILGRRQRIVEIGARRVRHGAEDAFVGRVDHRRAIATAPLAADVQLQLKV